MYTCISLISFPTSYKQCIIWNVQDKEIGACSYGNVINYGYKESKETSSLHSPDIHTPYLYSFVNLSKSKCHPSFSPEDAAFTLCAPHSKLHKEDWKNIIKKVDKRLAGWKGKCPSGRKTYACQFGPHVYSILLVGILLSSFIGNS